MPSADRPSRVLGVLVVHDGAAWLQDALAALDAQTYEDFSYVAVDNGSVDGSRDILLEHLDPADLLVADRDLGFGAAIAMALDASIVEDADFVLLVHDDLALDPDAVGHLVAHLAADPRLLAVGPKLVRWDDPARLVEVGMTVDITGRADPGIEGDERDQGQRDRPRQVMYVSTAGMLVRRDLLDKLGRFDRRYHVFREDLDLCWRGWLAGYDVEVVPAALGRHVGAAANYTRLGQTAFLGPRYFSERNTLATLLKNYSARRLLAVLPVYALIGLAKVLGFIATRRVSDAWQTMRAWGWNVLHLPTTRRLRAAAQAGRVRNDAELRPLFARSAPRARAYLEAVAEWVAGGDVALPEAPPDDLGEPPSIFHQVVHGLRARPILVVATAGVILGLIVSLPLLRPGTISGGEFAEWPSSSWAFLREYARGWSDIGSVATTRAPSPAQAVLGLVGFLTFGSAWLAQRVLLLGALPLAWLLALRAGRLVTVKRGPRLVAATAYAVSPPAIAALSTGRLSSLVVVALLPAVLIAYGAVVDPRTTPVHAWRATAGAALLTAVLIAFEPASVLGFLAGLLLAVVVLVAAPGAVGDRRSALLRVALAVLGAFVLLFPWSFTLFQPGSPVFGTTAPAGTGYATFDRWLLLTPEAPGFPSWVAGLGYVVAGIFGIVITTAKRLRGVAVLWTLVLIGVAAGWLLGRAGANAWTWPGTPLILAAAGYAGLLGIAFASGGERLAQHAFGWRQLASLATVVVVAVSVVASGRHLLDDPFSSMELDRETLPAYLAADEGEAGSFRVLVLADEGGAWRWDLAGPTGVTMLRYGAPIPPTMVKLVEEVLNEVASGADPGAAARLGLANIRYVIVPGEVRSETMRRALADQLALEPQPDADRLVFRVSSFVPRVALAATPIEAVIASRGDIVANSEVTRMTAVNADTWVGSAAGPATVLVADPPARGWQVEADGRRLELQSIDGLTRFAVPAETAHITVGYQRQGGRAAAIAFQIAAVLLTLSLLLRPPRFARRQEAAT